MNDLATRILATRRVETRTLHVPEWDADVKIKKLTDNEREAWERRAFDKDGKPRPQFKAKLITACLVDDDGGHLFEPDQEQALGELPSHVLAKVWTACFEYNKVSDDDLAELENA